MQHLNYICLAALAQELQAWRGARWVRSFSQQKDEWIGTLRHERRSMNLRVGCRSTLSYLTPDPLFRRARSNSADIFPEILDTRIEGVGLAPLDRVLMLEMSGGLSLAFKMYGNRSNILLLRDGAVVSLFRRSLKEDLVWMPAGALLRPPVPAPEWTGAAPDPLEPDFEARIRERLPIFDPVLIEDLRRRMLAGVEIQPAISDLFREAMQPPYYMIDTGETCELRLLPPPPVVGEVQAFDGLSEALRQFLRRALSRGDYQQRRRRLETALAKLGRSIRLKISSIEESGRKHDRRRSDEELGHLLMANLHAVPPRAAEVEVSDFYRDGRPLTLTLDPLLSPQENAAHYYRKHRDREEKQRRQAQQLEELLKLQERLEAVEAEWAEVSDRDGLRQFERRNSSFLQGESVQQAARLPFREVVFQGCRIWIGRNARSNDELTFRYARKQDLWFHAKDVSGSHVVLRREGSQNPPLAAVEHAAALAAWFSKERSNGLVPVSMTERRHVRKSKRMAPGQVALLREEVIMIEPAPPSPVGERRFT